MTESRKPDIISRSDLRERIDNDSDLKLIEVLSKESYRESHLPGAVNIPGDRIRDTIDKVVRDRSDPVVVYCASPSCTASDRAAELLTELVYTHVYHYRGGKQHWKEGGLPVKSEMAAEPA